MRRIDISKRSAINLRQAKIRTFLTSLAIAVGATTIALALAAGNGARNYVEEIVSLNGDMDSIQVNRRVEIEDNVDTGPARVDDDLAEGSSISTSEAISFERYYLKSSDVEKIEKIHGVRSVNPTVGIWPNYVRISGSDEKYEASIATKYDESAIELSAGILQDRNQLEDGTVVVPNSYIEAFGAENAEELIGQTIILGFESDQNEEFTKEFTVAAVDVGDTGGAFYYQEMFVISSSDGVDILRRQNTQAEEDYYGTLFVNTDGSVTPTDIKNNIEAIDSSRYDVMTFEDYSSTLFEVVNIVQYGLMGFGALAILASIFGVINTQYISVLERTSQIGLMKALGAKRKDISKLFRYEAALIGLFGGLIGLGVAWLVTLLNPAITDFLGLEEGTRMLQMHSLDSLILVLSLMVIAVVSGYLPARKAAKLDPIEALRTE